MNIIKVIPITGLPLDKPQTYTYFTSADLSEGSLVLVPLYKRQVKALVIKIRSLDQMRKIDIRKNVSYELKQIIKVLRKEPLLTKYQLQLISWMNQYYYAPVGLIVKTIMPEKLISNTKILFSPPPPEIPFQEKNNDQTAQYAFDTLKNRVSFYQTKIKSALADKKQILILVPQIFQIRNIAKEMEMAFPDINICEMSSNSKIKEFRVKWADIKNNQARIIVGTRSALFMPFYNLGLIIVDEEDNSGHISWDMTPKYDARKVAEKLSELHQAKLIFGSNVPSVEYYYKFSLDKQKKKLSASSANRQIVDMRDEIKRGNYSIFSDTLSEALAATLARKEHAILFVNRRGAFRFVMCRDCGTAIKCAQCDVSMVCHETKGIKSQEILKCHHCGAEAPIPTHCPKCESVKIKGFGIGTQRIEQEANKMFPKHSIIRIDSDTPEALKNSENIIPQPQIIIGTQMIFSFPFLKKVNLVGIVAIDSALNLPDFRSGEKAFQIISKLSGLGKQTVIQTYNPENVILQLAAKNDYLSFYQKELDEREDFFYPPFARLIKLAYRHKVSQFAEKEASRLNSQLQQFRTQYPNTFDILGPNSAFISKERNLWIWQIIIKVKDPKIQPHILKSIPSEWQIEVDPESVL